jgi:hypothetical protein
MTALDIKDRALVRVGFMGFDTFTRTDGEHLIQATCNVGLQGYDGSEEGPAANIFLSIPAPRQMTMQEAQRAFLTRVHDVLCRMASFSVDELEAIFARKREHDAKDGIAFNHPK